MTLKEALQLGVEACGRTAAIFNERERARNEGFDGDTAIKFKNAEIFLSIELAKIEVKEKTI